MCLAVPGQIVSIEGDTPLTRTGRVDFGGVVKKMNLAYVPKAKVGDYVMVHVGFALATIDEEEAYRVFEYIDSLKLGKPIPLDKPHSHIGSQKSDGDERECVHEIHR